MALAEEWIEKIPYSFSSISRRGRNVVWLKPGSFVDGPPAKAGGSSWERLIGDANGIP